MTPIILPAFDSEADEAAWWFDHREAHDEEVAQKMATGELRPNRLARRVLEKDLHAYVALKVEDVSLAATLAAKAGRDRDEYLSDVLHAALQHELSKVA